MSTKLNLHHVLHTRLQRVGKNLEMLLTFGQHQWRAVFSDTLHDLVTDHSIAALVGNKFLVELMKLRAMVGSASANGRNEVGRTWTVW